MYPILISWHDFILPTWYACFVLAALVALYVLFKLHTPALGFSRHELLNLYLICYVSGYCGARLLSIVIEDPCQGVLNCAARLFTLGSLTLYGGVLLAFICGTGYACYKKLPLGSILDCFVLALLPALCIGRIGCFLNGDDYGIVTDSIWGVVFPNLGDGQPRYPTQLFETAFCLLLFIGGYRSRMWLQQRLGYGATGLCLAAGYAVLRFGNEYLRGDYRGWVIVDKLSTSQFISIVILLAVAAALIPRVFSPHRSRH